MTSSGRPSAILRPETRTTRRCEKLITARMLELAHLHLRKVARTVVRFGFQAYELENFDAVVVQLRGLHVMQPLPCVDGVEQGNADIFGDRQTDKRARQLKAAGHTEPRALMRDQTIDIAAIEVHAAGLVGQRAAEAIDQRALAGAIWSDESDALASLNVEIDALEGDKAAEALAQILDLEKV